MNCLTCGNRSYSEYCFRHKPRKPIAKRGKRTIEYEKWRDEVAKPYLDLKFGRVCAACGGRRCGNKQLDVNHKKNRSTHTHLKMDLENVEYLGRFPCHFEETNSISQKGVDNNKTSMIN